MDAFYENLTINAFNGLKNVTDLTLTIHTLNNTKSKSDTGYHTLDITHSTSHTRHLTLSQRGEGSRGVALLNHKFSTKNIAFSSTVVFALVLTLASTVHRFPPITGQGRPTRQEIGWEKGGYQKIDMDEGATQESNRIYTDWDCMDNFFYFSSELIFHVFYSI